MRGLNDEPRTRMARSAVLTTLPTPSPVLDLPTRAVDREQSLMPSVRNVLCIEHSDLL